MLQFRFRPFVFLLIFLLILLQYELWFQPGGLIQWFRLREQIADQNEKNAQLDKRNGVLIAKVQDLQHGNQVIEGYAREDLGMVKKDESYYQIVNQGEKKN